MIENGLRERLSGVHGTRNFKNDAARKLTHDDGKILYGLSKTQY